MFNYILTRIILKPVFFSGIYNIFITGNFRIPGNIVSEKYQKKNELFLSNLLHPENLLFLFLLPS